MSSRIEQLIDEIEAYIDNCKYKAFSTDVIMVNKAEIDELLRELRMKTRRKSNSIRESSAIEKLFWMMPSKRQKN